MVATGIVASAAQAQVVPGTGADIPLAVEGGSAGAQWTAEHSTPLCAPACSSPGRTRSRPTFTSGIAVVLASDVTHHCHCQHHANVTLCTGHVVVTVKPRRCFGLKLMPLHLWPRVVVSNWCSPLSHVARPGLKVRNDACHQQSVHRHDVIVASVRQTK